MAMTQQQGGGAMVTPGMKRAAGGEDEEAGGYNENGEFEAASSQKKSRPTVIVRFLFHTKTAKAISGDDRAQLQQLRQYYGTHAAISILECSGPESILVYDGDRETLNAFLTDVIAYVIQSNISSVQSGEVTLPSNGRNHLGEGDNENVDLRLLLHQSQAGAVIGRGGCVINAWRQEPGVRTLKLYSDACPNSTDRVFQVVGNADILITIVQRVLDHMEENPVKGRQSDYTASNYDEQFSGEYGGWVDANSPAPPPRPNAGRGGRGGGAGGRGGAMRGGYGGGPPGGMPYGMAGGMPGMPGGMPGMGGPPQSVQVSIADRLAGSIIGKGGARINQVRQESGATIKMESAAPGESERVISISGTYEQIQAAQFLMQACVRKYASGGAY